MPCSKDSEQEPVNCNIRKNQNATSMIEMGNIFSRIEIPDYVYINKSIAIGNAGITVGVILLLFVIGICITHMQ